MHRKKTARDPGEEHAYHELRATALRIARRMVGRQDAEDVAHEGLLAWLAYRRDHAVDSPVAVLTTMIRRRACDRRRRTQREQLVGPEYLLGIPCEPQRRCGALPAALHATDVLPLGHGRRQRIVLQCLCEGEHLATAAARIGTDLKEIRRVARDLAQRIASRAGGS